MTHSHFHLAGKATVYSVPEKAGKAQVFFAVFILVCDPCAQRTEVLLTETVSYCLVLTQPEKHSGAEKLDKI